MTQEEEELLNDTIENLDGKDKLEKVSLNSTDKVRFSSADWFDQARSLNVAIYGVGGIGSWTAVNIARLGVDRITIIDPDTVNEVNMAGQLYQYSDIGKPKVETVTGIMSNFAQYYHTYTYRAHLSDITFFMKNVTICGFDNMEARGIAFELWLKYLKSVQKESRNRYMFIDARLAAEELQIYCIMGDDLLAQGNYGIKGLFSDEEAEEAPCTYKQTSYCAAMIGSLITSYVANFAARLAGFDSMERAIPYFTYYNCGTAILKQRMYAEKV